MEEQKNEINKQPENSKEKNGKNIAVAVMGYIFPFLFFIPLLTEDGKKNSFAKFHANQQLIFLLLLVVGLFVAQVLKVIFIGYVLFLIIFVSYFIFMIMGIINSAKGEMKKLPVIGEFEIIK